LDLELIIGRRAEPSPVSGGICTLLV
jgi:hypothetical protein